MPNRHQRRAARAKAPVRAAPATPPALMPSRREKVRLRVLSFYEKLDRSTDKMLEQYTPSCRRGCHACCRMPVQASVEEALVMLEQYPDAVRRALPEVRLQEARLTELAVDLDNYLSPPDANVLSRRWWDEGRSCAFLVDGECSVYEARPYACRNYFVLSDPALCGAEGGTEVKMLTTIDRAEGLRYFISSLGGRAHLGLLPTVVLGALGEAQIGQEAYI